MTLDLSIPITLFLIPFLCLYRILRLLLRDFTTPMAEHKPLPAIPGVATVPNLTTLSIDARGHRGRFIRYILADADLDDAVELWAAALEDALDMLSDAVARGRWLAAVKRGRRTAEHEQTRKPMARTDTMASAQSGVSDASEQTAESIAFPQSPNEDALRQIRELAAQPVLPNPKLEGKHLLLCVAPLGSRIAVPSEDSGFDLVPANTGCVFKSATFALPEEDSDDRSSILYGLVEWNTTSPAKLVGGTFTFKGVTSPPQHHALCKALRISIYMHLSLLLEQQFLSNSGVRLHFPVPKPRISAVSYQQPPTSPALSTEAPSPRSRQKTFLPGILSFFSKKNTGLHRTITSPAPSARSGASLDLTSSTVSSRDSSVPASPRLSDDGGSRLRRFSFISDPRPSFLKPAPTPAPAADATPFSAALARLTAAGALLSSSAGVRFAPPPLITDLAAKERAAPGRRLTGDERAGLGSILGWDARSPEHARGMGGAPGFARMQALGVLLSRHVPGEAPASNTVSGASSVASSVASIEGEPERVFAACDRPYWATYRYYARDGAPGADRSLGEVVRAFSKEAREPCARTGCAFRRGEHVVRIVHGGVRVVVAVEEDEEGKDGKKEEGKKDEEKEDEEEKEGAGIKMWLSCAVCRKRTDRVEMNDGAFLFSYAKFLELLVYSPAIGKLTPALCEHTSPPLQIQTPASSSSRDAETGAELPAARLQIVRHFSAHGHVVSFALSAIEDIFELRVPRLQIVRKGGGGGDKSARTSMASSRDEEGKDGKPVEEEKRTLRREIKAWWEGVADHMDKLETTIMGSTLVGFRKALPRLPSVDDAWEDDDDAGSETDGDEEQTTPKGLKPRHHFITGLPPSAPTTPQIAKSAQEFFPPPALPRASSAPTSASLNAAPSTPAAAPAGDSIALLASLRLTFQGTEQALYAQLAQTPAGALNDVRRAFVAAARGAEKRLGAWQGKHMPGHGRSKRGGNVQRLEAPEPEWWAKGCHTAPGGSIIIREDDWGSIIAFTMSTTDYSRELASMSLVRSSSLTLPAAALTPTLTNPSSASSFFSAPSNYKQLFASSTHNAQPDPDQEDVVWHEPESYSAVISRKEHPRDVTSLLSLREVLRQKAPLDGASVLPGSSRFGSMGSAATKASSGAPPSAWAKPDVQISMHAAGGEVSGMPEAADSAGRILQEFDAVSVEAAAAAASRPGSALSGSAVFADMYIKRGKASSILSVESSGSDATVGGKSREEEREAQARSVGHEGALTVEPGTSSDLRRSKSASETMSGSPTPTPSSFTNTLTSGLSSAMRYMLSNGEIPRPSLFSKNHHGLLAPADAGPAIDERPHIKYDWTIGKRLKFSCTVYYAKQFDSLRKRCGIDEVYLKSLGRSANWEAEGGKSKSNFWKTADDRFIIKTLVNAWNVADLQVLIELAPSYFRYMDATASRPTVLAKLIGFYTIEIRNLETGTVQSKADLLVMENLFYDQKIVKTFDLKGIQGRKVKSAASGTAQNVKTLFDGEWIEGQQRTLTLVRPHSKVVLREAIRSDAEFLAKSNIMDYSLLLGVDQERKQIACGLVDTIGSYTFAKTLEYKAKQGLNSGNGRDVTVIPPAEYQERFVSALEGYFLACPDKWSRSMDDTKPINDPALLPSVL
ncbi:hypothetical protein B0H17DRAFT_1069454 [Mycena rosella]|uniref:PIPK domain-containing protein n=1 Tax=Mycena rosella TaxID=1033263 RepID=A0AAD7GCB3_MYCRO|nr:hypothetical protein B0H17DRAFT_1069454 [Mycena rosella]